MKYTIDIHKLQIENHFNGTAADVPRFVRKLAAVTGRPESDFVAAQVSPEDWTAAVYALQDEAPDLFGAKDDPVCGFMAYSTEQAIHMFEAVAHLAAAQMLNDETARKIAQDMRASSRKAFYWKCSLNSACLSLMQREPIEQESAGLKAAQICVYG